MSTSRILPRAVRALTPLRSPSCSTYRPFSSSARRLADSPKSVPLNERGNDGLDVHRKAQMETPLNPHMTNTNSTIANDFPSVGTDKPPPELISIVDGNFTPQDSVPENTERMTGGTQDANPLNDKNSSSSSSGGGGGESEGFGGSGAIDAKTEGELGVGEIDGGSFKVEPLRRTGEDANTMRARLLCPFAVFLPTSTPPKSPPLSPVNPLKMARTHTHPPKHKKLSNVPT